MNKQQEILYKRFSRTKAQRERLVYFVLRFVIIVALFISAASTYVFSANTLFNAFPSPFLELLSAAFSGTIAILIYYMLQYSFEVYYAEGRYSFLMYVCIALMLFNSCTDLIGVYFYAESTVKQVEKSNLLDKNWANTAKELKQRIAQEKQAIRENKNWNANNKANWAQYNKMQKATKNLEQLQRTYDKAFNAYMKNKGIEEANYTTQLNERNALVQLRQKGLSGVVLVLSIVSFIFAKWCARHEYEYALEYVQKVLPKNAQLTDRQAFVKVSGQDRTNKQTSEDKKKDKQTINVSGNLADKVQDEINEANKIDWRIVDYLDGSDLSYRAIAEKVTEEFGVKVSKNRVYDINKEFKIRT